MDFLTWSRTLVFCFLASALLLANAQPYEHQHYHSDDPSGHFDTYSDSSRQRLNPACRDCSTDHACEIFGGSYCVSSCWMCPYGNCVSCRGGGPYRPPNQCRRENERCNYDRRCCRGLDCRGGFCRTDFGSCSNAGQKCNSVDHCCGSGTLKCRNQTCCKRNTSMCYRDSECCSGKCRKGSCCKPPGRKCKRNDQCCSRNCGRDGFCKPRDYTPRCVFPNGSCQMDSQCCGGDSAKCNKRNQCCLKPGGRCNSDAACCGRSSKCGRNRTCCKTSEARCKWNSECCSGICHTDPNGYRSCLRRDYREVGGPPSHTRY